MSPRRSRTPSPAPRRRSQRRLTIACTAVVAALAVAACGGGSDDSATGTSDDESVCPVDALDGRDPADGPVEVVVWFTDIGLPGVTQRKIADQYNASQDKVHVEVEFQGTYEEQMAKFRAAEGDPSSLPAIVQPDDTSTQYMADSGSAIPAQACIDADPDAKAIYDDMVPIVSAAYSIDGTLWPGAVSASNGVMYFNEGHFEAAALDPADPPETLAEVRDVAEAIRDADIDGVDAPLVMRIESWPLEFWTSGANASVVNNDNGRSDVATKSEYANDTTLEILDWMSQMVDDGLLKLTPAADPLQPFLAMAGETSSMLIDAASAITTVNGAIDGTLTPSQLGMDGEGTLDLSFPELRLSVAQLPGVDAAGKGQMGGSAWYLVNTGDPEVTAGAWDYLKYFNDTPQQVTWALEGSYFPVRESAIEDPELQASWTDTRQGRWMATAYEGFTSLDPDFPGPVIGPYTEFRLTVRSGLEDIAYNDADPASTMDSIDAEFQDELDQYVQDLQS